MKPWAILPVKEMVEAKQRLAPLLSPEERLALMQMMLRDVLTALSAAQGLAGIALVTLDPWAQALAEAHDARIITEGAREGHTGAVTAAASVLQAQGVAAILTLPGDIPAQAPAPKDQASPALYQPDLAWPKARPEHHAT